jgi:hypothetical protein
VYGRVGKLAVRRVHLVVEKGKLDLYQAEANWTGRYHWRPGPRHQESLAALSSFA